MIQNYTVIENVSALKAETLSHLKHLDQNYFPTPWDSESWDQLFSSEGRFIMTASNDEEVTGFTLFDVNIVDSFAHLLKILINPAIRQKGMGKALLAESLKGLKARGIKSFFLEVEEHNHAAIKLYERAGFEIIHKKKQFYKSGASALIMTLNV